MYSTETPKIARRLNCLADAVALLDYPYSTMAERISTDAKNYVAYENSSAAKRNNPLKDGYIFSVTPYGFAFEGYRKQKQPSCLGGKYLRISRFRVALAEVESVKFYFKTGVVRFRFSPNIYVKQEYWAPDAYTRLSKRKESDSLDLYLHMEQFLQSHLLANLQVRELLDQSVASLKDELDFKFRSYRRGLTVTFNNAVTIGRGVRVELCESQKKAQPKQEDFLYKEAKEVLKVCSPMIYPVKEALRLLKSAY